MKNLNEIRENFLLRRPSDLTRANYRSDFRSFESFFRPWTGKEDETSVLKYIDQLKKQELQPSTIKSRVIRMRKFYTYLMEKGLRKDNPVDLKATPRIIDRRIPKAIDMDDFKRLAEVLRTDTVEGLQTVVIIALAAYDALRCGEIAKLRRGDIEESSVGLRMQVRGKCGILASPLMWSQSEKVMRQYLKYMEFKTNNSPLFPSPNDISKPITTRTIRRKVDAVFRLAGIRKGLSVHSLRHFHSVILHSQGVPLTQISKRLRHQNLETTFRYLSDMPQLQTRPDCELHKLITVELGGRKHGKQ